MKQLPKILCTKLYILMSIGNTVAFFGMRVIQFYADKYMEIVLDVDPDIALERTHKRDESPDAIESNGAEFLRMINSRYVNSFQNVPGWDYPQYKIITDNLEISDIVCYSIEYILSFLGYTMARSVAYDTTKRYEDTINGEWNI